MNKALTIVGVSLFTVLSVALKCDSNQKKEVASESKIENQILPEHNTASKNLANLSACEKPVVKILPDTVIQGQTALIDIKSKQTLINPYYIYNNKKIRIYKENDSTYTGMIATDPNQKTGKNTILFSDENKKLAEKVDFHVKKAIFGVQNVKLSKSVYSLKATPDENLKIRKALDTQSDTLYFTNMPYNKPTEGPMVSKYGTRRFNNGIDTHEFHKGIDIKAPMGQPIRAIQPGKVLVAEQFNLNGGTVIVDHGHGVTSAYLHMSKIDAKVGQKIDTKQIIGRVGTTGHSSGPHLHWGLYVNGTAVNPTQSWMKAINKFTKSAQKQAGKTIAKVAR